MTRAQRVWHSRMWLLLSVVLAIALLLALVRRHDTQRVSAPLDTAVAS